MPSATEFGVANPSIRIATIIGPELTDNDETDHHGACGE
jgi:hypothetical protein